MAVIAFTNQKKHPGAAFDLDTCEMNGAPIVSDPVANNSAILMARIVDRTGELSHDASCIRSSIRFRRSIERTPGATVCTGCDAVRSTLIK